MLTMPHVPQASGSSLFLLSLLFPVMTTPVPAQLAWVKRSPNTIPPARHGHSMAYDSTRQQVVLFGGNGATATLDDTWTFDGKTWSRHQPSVAPGARVNTAMAYDAKRQQTILFSGEVGRGKYAAGTWSWDGKRWSLLSPTTSPTPRGRHAMVYDTKRNRVILFGGKIGSGRWIGDTWEWNGSTWTRLKPTTSPPGRDGHRMAYDASRDRVVLFGGWVSSASADTWEWNGTNWAKQSPVTSPPARVHHALTYDSARKRTVLLGGTDSKGTNFSDTWEWDGKSWARMPHDPARPGDRAYVAMAYDGLRGRTVLFGGSNSTGSVLSDTWEFMPNPAAYTTFGSGCAGAATPPLLRASSPPKIGKAFSLDVTNLKSPTLGVLIFGTSDKTWNGASLPMDLAFLGMKGCKLLVSWEKEVLIATRRTGWVWGKKIPLNTAFIGATFFNQAWVLDSMANPRGIATSNGGKGVVGF